MVETILAATAGGQPQVPPIRARSATLWPSDWIDAMPTRSSNGAVAGPRARGAWARCLGAAVALACAVRPGSPHPVPTVTAPSDEAGSDAKPSLEELAADADLEVAAAAIVAVATRPGAEATLAAALGQRSDEEYQRLAGVMVLRAGTAGVLTLLAGLPEAAAPRWRRQEIVFGTINTVNDPRGADALAAFLAGRPHPHLAFRAATALAQIDDWRAVAPLAAHLRLDPAALYARGTPYEQALGRSDSERAEAAILLGELAALHPERHGELRAAAEAALLAWTREDPAQPTLAFRALAAMESAAVIPDLRALARPKTPLQPAGPHPPQSPSEFQFASEALRWLGALRDAPSWRVLLDALAARPRAVDLGLDSPERRYYSGLYWCVRQLGLGAAEGLGRWGDRAAVEPLLRHVADPMNTEETRRAACLALPRVATERDLARLIDEALRPRRGARDSDFQRACLLQGFGARGVGHQASRLIPLLDPPTPPIESALAARAIGRTALDPAVESELLRRAAWGTDPEPAILALLLGGTEDAVRRAFTRASGSTAVQHKRLLDLWYGSFMSLPLEDYDVPLLVRVARNAEVLTTLPAAGEAGQQAPFALGMALGFLADTGTVHAPGWLVLRQRVFAVAQGADAADRRDAARALSYLGAHGHLLALAAAP